MLIRRTLQFALVAVLAALILTVLWNVGLGVWDGGLGDREPTLGAVIASYHLWGRWARLAILVLFVALLFVVPFLPGARRASHLFVAGAAIALVGDLGRLSGVSNWESLVMNSEVPTDFVAGRIVEISAGTAPTYTWGSGVILMGLSLLIVSLDSEDRDWTRASAVLGIALGLTGLSDMGLFGMKGIAWFVALATMTITTYWLLIALRVTTASGEPLTRQMST